MKILVDCSTAKMGGARTYLEQLLREISGRDLGQEWVVYGPPGFRATLEVSGSSVHLRERPFTLPPSVGYLKWLTRILPQVVTREGVDVVFAATGFGMMRPPCPQLLLIRNPIYFSKLYLSKIQNLRLKVDVLARRWLSLRMIDRSDAVVFPTRAMQEMVAGYHSLRKVRCFIAPYGCDVETFRQKPGQAAGLPEAVRQARGRFFLNVSHYCSQKNLSVLFNALGILRRRGMVRPLVLTTRLRAAANCTFREDRAVIDSEHLDGQVIQLGSVPRKQLPALYEAAGLFVFPSYVESFGHPLVEAMAAGLPIVAADTPVNREICGPAAVYAPAFDPEAWADQIMALLESPERCQRLQAASQAQAERFSWQTHVRILLQALEGILESRRHEKV